MIYYKTMLGIIIVITTRYTRNNRIRFILKIKISRARSRMMVQGKHAVNECLCFSDSVMIINYYLIGVYYDSRKIFSSLKR